MDREWISKEKAMEMFSRENTNFSISGSADNAPKTIQITIDKEWIKRLLDDYKRWLNCNCTDPLGRKINNDEFLETSLVWNGKDNRP